MNAHIVAWLLHVKARELRRAQTDLNRSQYLLTEERRKRMALEFAMPINGKGDLTVPCGTCGAKMTFTNEALRTHVRRPPTRG